MPSQPHHKIKPNVKHPSYIFIKLQPHDLRVEADVDAFTGSTSRSGGTNYGRIPPF